ncbi:(2Fe-2S)-binding protein [Streptomyces sp. AJS327]|uniref:(2Fe-2S)-binding protein n=1 Tax=Streptomyces sp. AJS327 TaxID=2545265 RepID=UPI0015DE7F1B|nr:(2Fe-2S)-binding protein [Streptomyces sp. AJS327]MBA0052100.1 (2Fe-2S)-binding protein [Streptomyces sp. AJS327]
MTVLVHAGVPSGISPLTAAYGRLSEVLPALRITVDGAPATGEGWVRATELAAGEAAFEDYLAHEAAETVRVYGQPGRGDVVAGFGLHRYAWPLCLAITLPWFLSRRVPRLPAGNVAFHRESWHLSLRVDEFACLPDDPAAGRADARPVRDEEELRTAVREAVAEHLTPLLEAFRPRMRRGTSAMWGAVTDEITEGLWYVGGLLGEEPRAVAEAERLLPGKTAPYARGAAFRELTGASGERLRTRDRASCCLYYTLRPDETCVTCPRTCDTERVRRLDG